jgi:hypothetical protein
MESKKSFSEMLDEQVLGRLFDRWRYVRKQEYYGAFVVTKSSLLALETLLANAVGSDASSNEVKKSISVVYSGKPSETYTSVSDILELRNPSIGRITGICIVAASTNALALVLLDDLGLYSGHPIVFMIAANSDSIFGKTEAAVETELANIRCWYSRMRGNLDRLQSMMCETPRIVPRLLFVVALAFLTLTTVADWFRYEQWRATAEEVVAKSEMSLDPNSAAKLDTLKQILNKHKHSALMTVVRLASLVAFAYVLGYGILMLGYLFPRIVFEIGEGIKRHEQVIWPAICDGEYCHLWSTHPTNTWGYHTMNTGAVSLRYNST